MDYLPCARQGGTQSEVRVARSTVKNAVSEAHLTLRSQDRTSTVMIKAPAWVLPTGEGGKNTNVREQ